MSVLNLAMFAFIACDAADDTGRLDTADTAAPGDPPVDVEIPEWPDCGRLVDPFAFTDANTILAAYDASPPDLVALVAGADYAESGRDDVCPTYFWDSENTSISGDCASSSGATYSGTYTDSFVDGNLDIHASEFAFAWPEVDYSFAADGAWSVVTTDDSVELVGNGTTARMSEGDPWSGERTDDGSYACVAGLCDEAGYVSLQFVQGLTGDFCYAGASHGVKFPGETNPGVARLVGAQRAEVRWNDDGIWVSIDGGAWALM